MTRSMLTPNDRFKFKTVDNETGMAVTVICEDWARFVWAQNQDVDWIDHAKLFMLRLGVGIYDEVAFLKLDSPPEHQIVFMAYRINRQWFVQFMKAQQSWQTGPNEWEEPTKILLRDA